MANTVGCKECGAKVLRSSAHQGEDEWSADYYCQVCWDRWQLEDGGLAGSTKASTPAPVAKPPDPTMEAASSPARADPPPAPERPTQQMQIKNGAPQEAVGSPSSSLSAELDAKPSGDEGQKLAARPRGAFSRTAGSTPAAAASKPAAASSRATRRGAFSVQQQAHQLIKKIETFDEPSGQEAKDNDDAAPPVPDAPAGDAHADKLPGAWEYGKKPTVYRIKRPEDGRLRWEGTSSGVPVSGILEATGIFQIAELTSLEGVVAGTIRLRYSAEEDMIVSNFKATTKSEWTKDIVATRTTEEDILKRQSASDEGQENVNTKSEGQGSPAAPCQGAQPGDKAKNEGEAKSEGEESLAAPSQEKADIQGKDAPAATCEGAAPADKAADGVQSSTVASSQPELGPASADIADSAVATEPEKPSLTSGQSASIKSSLQPSALQGSTPSSAAMKAALQPRSAEDPSPSPAGQQEQAGSDSVPAPASASAAPPEPSAEAEGAAVASANADPVATQSQEQACADSAPTPASASAAPPEPSAEAESTAVASTEADPVATPSQEQACADSAPTPASASAALPDASAEAEAATAASTKVDPVALQRQEDAPKSTGAEPPSAQAAAEAARAVDAEQPQQTRAVSSSQSHSVKAMLQPRSTADSGLAPAAVRQYQEDKTSPTAASVPSAAAEELSQKSVSNEDVPAAAADATPTSREDQQGHSQAADDDTVEVIVKVSLKVPAASSIREVKQAFVQKLGQRKGASKIKMFHQCNGDVSVCTDTDLLDFSRDLFVEGVQVITDGAEAAEPVAATPSASSKDTPTKQVLKKKSKEGVQDVDVVEVLIKDDQRGDVRVAVPASGTVLDVKKALVLKLGRGDPSSLQLLTSDGSGCNKCMDTDKLGSMRKFTSVSGRGSSS